MIPLDQNPSRRGRYGKDWHGMSEKGLERETEGISVGEREPVVADSSPKGGRLRSSWKKLWKGRKRKALALLLVVAIAGGVVIWRGRGQTASAATTYQEAAVERRSITNSLSSSGTLEPADSYTVNTLVSGEILSDTFEKGDQVEEGQLLYTIDSSNAASSQTQAQNSYSQAQTSYEQAVKAKYPQADLSGTVSEVYVNEGDSVSAGTQLLKIVADENIYIDFYFTYADSGDFYIGQTATVFIDGFAGTLTGTVAAVSSSSAAVSTGVPLTTVRVRLANPGLVTSDYTASAVIGSYSSYGQASIKVGASSVITAEASGKVAGFNWLVGDTISSGDRICTITGDSVDNQIESARISVSNASTSLENARDNLEDYSVTAPISGTVVTKNAKAGDNIEGGSGSTLCVIYDLSYLEMTMSIDELDISSVEVGQEVRITADAVEGKTYTGVVTEVSREFCNRDARPAGDDPCDLIFGNALMDKTQICVFYLLLLFLQLFFKLRKLTVLELCCLIQIIFLLCILDLTMDCLDLLTDGGKLINRCLLVLPLGLLSRELVMELRQLLLKIRKTFLT